jgi:hypothetical protein
MEESLRRHNEQLVVQLAQAHELVLSTQSSMATLNAKLLETQSHLASVETQLLQSKRNEQLLQTELTKLRQPKAVNVSSTQTELTSDEMKNQSELLQQLTMELTQLRNKLINSESQRKVAELELKRVRKSPDLTSQIRLKQQEITSLTGQLSLQSEQIKQLEDRVMYLETTKGRNDASFVVPANTSPNSTIRIIDDTIENFQRFSSYDTQKCVAVGGRGEEAASIADLQKVLDDRIHLFSEQKTLRRL